MLKLLFAITFLACAFDVAAATPALEDAECTRRAPIAPFDALVLSEINRARQAPAQYAATVREVFASMDASGVYSRGPRRVATAEGSIAVDEAVHYLARAEPVPPLRMASCLNMAAASHAKAKGSIGSDGHVGITGTTPSDRASTLTSRPVSCSENIAYGYADVAELVSALIVDDGVAGRGHRRNLFDARMTSFGAGRARHLLRNSIEVHLFCLDAILDVSKD